MNNKSMILAGSFAILLFFAAAVWWLLTPNWVALFPNSVPEASQQNILLLLSKHNIEYKVDGDKNTILIKSPELKRAQLMLAENGQPEEISTGLEVFNSSDYGLSEFAQSVNYQRGMEEELSRTVRKLKGIKDARIHLTIKKDSIFEDRKLPPKATVVIKPVSGTQVSKESVRGIQQIVAAAVPNLQAHQVVVVTDAGDILSTTDSDVEEDTSEIEDKFTNRISNLLQGILNKDEYKVSVNVVMDYKKKTTVEENYFPDMNTGKGFLAKKMTSEKTTTDAVSNSPQSNRNNEEEYLFSRERSEIVYPQGQLVKITVGLVVNRTMSDIERDSLSKLIFTSLGMVESRGDKISIFVAPKPKDQNLQLTTVVESQSPVLENNRIHEAVPAIDKFLLENKYLLVILFGALVALLLILLSLVLRLKTANINQISDVELRKLSNDLKAWVNQP